MASVTLTRDGESIDIRVVEEAGESLLSTTFGKPEVQVRNSGGSLNPRVTDEFSAMENYNLVGKLFDHAKSHALADMVKSTKLSPITLEIPLDEYPDSVSVVPGAGQEGALSLSYPSGKRNTVDVNLSLTRVDYVEGSIEQQAETPTSSGSGPVQLDINGTIVDIPTAALSVERSVGRPNDVVRRQPRTSDPYCIAKPKVTSDVFTLGFDTITDIPATLNAITDGIFRTRLGRGGVKLNFNGKLGLGEFDVIPVGSSPFRQVHSAGEDWVRTPTLEFRRILV